MPLIEAAPAMPLLPDLFSPPAALLEPTAEGPSFAAMLTQATPVPPSDPVLDGHEVAGALPADLAPAPLVVTPAAESAHPVQTHAPTLDGLRDAMEQLRATLTPAAERPAQAPLEALRTLRVQEPVPLPDAKPAADPIQILADPALQEALPEPMSEPLAAPELPPDQGASPLLAEPTSQPASPTTAAPSAPLEVTTPTADVLPASAAELPQELPPLPEIAPVPQQVKVRVDAGLDLHVRADGDAVEVMLEGAVRAMEGLADIAPELRNELASSGFELASFEARTRDERAPTQSEHTPSSRDGARDDAPDTPSETHHVGLGQVINAVA